MPTIVPTRRSASTNEDHETERRRLAGAEEWDRLGARRVSAYGLLGVAAVQLAVADAAYLIYGFYNDWRIPIAAVDAWLGATIVQVIGALNGDREGALRIRPANLGSPPRATRA